MQNAAQLPVPEKRGLIEAGFDLPIHAVAIINGRIHLIDKKVQDAWLFQDWENNESILRTNSQIAELQAAGKFYLDGKSIRHGQVPLLSPLAVGKNAHEENNRKLGYVTPCLSHPDFRRSAKWLNPFLAAIAVQLGEKQPGASTVLKWIDQYLLNADSVGSACLTNRHDQKGRWGNRLPEFQEKAISVGIDRWLAPKTTKALAYVAVCKWVRIFDARFGRALDKAGALAPFVNSRNRLKPPSQRTFERRCDQVDHFVVNWGKKGPTYAKKHGQTVATLPRPDRPYAELLVDHCKLDIICVDPDGQALGRPDLILFMDRATAMIAGYGLGFEEPSYAAFVQGLEHTMYPKSPRMPGVSNPWPYWGRPEALYVDNALHFIGDNIRAAAAELKINIVQFRPKQPELKGDLERFFGTLNTALLHSLPGTTLENVLVRRDHENLLPPCLTVDELRGIINFWICDIYHASVTRGLGPLRGVGGVPLATWMRKLKEEKYLTPPLPRRELFIRLAGDSKTTTIQKYGIEWNHIKYQHPVLDRVLAHQDHNSKARYRVTRNPMNIGEVYLTVPFIPEPLLIPACPAHIAYATGRTLHQHIVAINYARMRIKQDVDFESLQRAKAELETILSALMRAPGRKTLERRVARYVDGNIGRHLRSQAMAEPKVAPVSGFLPTEYREAEIEIDGEKPLTASDDKDFEKYVRDHDMEAGYD